MSEIVAIAQQGLAGKYQPYPEYKDSGVEWLGKIPSHWCTTVLKRLCCLTTGLTPPTSDEANYAEDGYPWVRPEDIDESGSETKASKFVSSDGWQLLRKIESNSTLICCIGTIGKCGYVRRTVSTNQQITAATFTKSGRYNYYLLQAARTQLEELATGNVLKILNTERLGALNLVKVPVEEGDTIAAFLDYETARIDRLIAQQQRLIELLKEKRQAVISHAVTKGLNPNAPMKDSGVEWLGKVPEHWAVTTLRNLIRTKTVVLQDGNHGEQHPTAAEYVDDGIPFLMANNIRDGRIDLTDCKRITKNRADMLRIGFAKSGDMLLTHKGTVGEVAIIPADISEPYWMLTPQVTYYRWAENKFDAAFYMYQFQSKSISTQLDIIGSKQSTRAYVGLIAQGDLVVTIPPVLEQRAIREELRKHVTRFDRLFARATGLIELLQERRTALISAAVTGKIDVRGWNASNERNSV